MDDVAIKYKEAVPPKLSLDKLLATIAFLFIAIALFVVARTLPAAGYEISIYDAYPQYFWFLIIASSTCGIVILIHQAFAKQKSNWWLAGLCIVIFSNSILLGLPFFHGYAFYPKGDALTHVGMMKDIIATGHIGIGNFYPVVHILGVSLLDVTGLSLGAVVNLLFVFWSIVYLLNMYLLVTVVTDHRGQALLITAFACPLIFSCLHTLIHPSMLSLFMVPLLLYCYHRRQKISSGKIATTLLLILLMLSITFTHPVTSLFVIALVLAFNLSRFLYQQIANRKGLALQNSAVTAGNYSVSLIMLAVFFIWYFPYTTVQRSIKHAWDFLVYGDNMSLFTSQISTLATAEITTSQTIELFIYRYGAIFIYGIISAIATVMVLSTSLRKKTQTDPMSFTYAILFIVAFAASVFSLFGFTGEYDPVRISRLFLIIAPVVSGLAIYEFINRRYKHPFNSDRLKLWKALIGITTILILTAGVLSILNAYGSPRTVGGNWQVSRMEIAGTEWFGNHQDGDIIATEAGVGLRRFEDFNFGVESRPFPRAKLDPESIPSHFGYDKNSSIAETFNFRDRYLLTCEAVRINIMLIPENIRDKAHQYTEEDFTRLSADSTAVQIYTNSEFEVWRVYGE